MNPREDIAGNAISLETGRNFTESRGGEMDEIVSANPVEKKYVIKGGKK